MSNINALLNDNGVDSEKSDLLVALSSFFGNNFTAPAIEVYVCLADGETHKQL